MVDIFLEKGVGLYASLRWSFTPNARTYIAPEHPQQRCSLLGLFPRNVTRSRHGNPSLWARRFSVSQLVYAARLQQDNKPSQSLEGGVHLITLGGGCAEKKVEPRLRWIEPNIYAEQTAVSAAS